MDDVYFIIAAIVGILLLETIQYIEHYGLREHAMSTEVMKRPAQYILGIAITLRSNFILNLHAIPTITTYQAASIKSFDI